MNTNKYEFDSTDEMLKLFDFHFDQNVPVQGPEAQALEAQGPENQAPEDQGPENQAPEDQGPENQAPEAQGLENQAPEAQGPENQAPEDQALEAQGPENQAPDDSSRAIDQLLKVGMSPADAKNAMMDETLAKTALSDPISVKRKSAARSRKSQAERIAILETRLNTLRTQRAALLDREALCKKNVDALTHENTQLRSEMEFIAQKKLSLDLHNAELRAKAGQVHPNSGPPGMMIPFGVPDNNYALNSGPPGMMMPFGVPQNYALNSGPPGMMMPFAVPHNNFDPNPHQQAAQGHARMQQQQQQQPQLVPPSRTNVASGEGADAAGSDAGGGDDAPGQGP